MWLFLATFNALSGLRYCAHASLFSGLLTLGYGAIELAIMAQLPIAWSPKLSFIGVELNFANCAQTVVFATMPAWFAAIVAYRSRRLMIYAAKEAAERAALHELAEAKDRFLSIASHELRSPIAALCASVDLIALDPDALAETSTRDVIIDRMKARALRLMKLVEQLLDSTRLGRDVPLEPVPCDLSQICRSSAEGLGPDGQRLIIEGGGAIAGRWDPSRLEQVVTNLMSNALRYSPPDKPVIVRLASDHRRALLTVADEGIGIPAEQLGQVFSPFFRATNAHRTNRRGLGLGLFIAHDIVRRHGGDVRVRSTEGVGTTFTVELPLQPPA
jgi:signal transduction histidine kinase